MNQEQSPTHSVLTWHEVSVFSLLYLFFGWSGDESYLECQSIYLLIVGCIINELNIIHIVMLLSWAIMLYYTKTKVNCWSMLLASEWISFRPPNRQWVSHVSCMWRTWWDGLSGLPSLRQKIRRLGSYGDNFTTQHNTIIPVYRGFSYSFRSFIWSV